MGFKPMGHQRNQKGFTIMELLVASAIFMTVMAAGSSFFSNLSRSSTVNEQMTDMQQDIRIAMLTIARDISMAGYNTTSSGACANAITPTNSSTSPDQINVVGMTNSATTLAALANNGASTLTLAAAVPAGSISLNGIKATTATAGTTVTINPPLIEGETFPIGTPILTPNCIEYDVNVANRQLNRTVNGVASVLANGVLDMQLAYASDANGDGLIDDANASGAFDTGDFVNLPANFDNIRLVRISLFVQTSKANDRYINGAAVTLEDHDPTTDGGYDIANYQPFRSRVLTRIVRPRNMGL